jgi:hypothetical protein
LKPLPSALAYFMDSYDKPASWRTDLGDIQRDISFEMLRRLMIIQNDQDWDEQNIRCCFLYKEVFEAICNLQMKH